MLQFGSCPRLPCLGKGPNALTAQVIAGQIEVLRGLKTGIEHARQFATEQATTFFGSYLPETLGEVVDLFDEAGKLDEIRDNATVLLSAPGCDASARSRSAPFLITCTSSFRSCGSHRRISAAHCSIRIGGATTSAGRS